MDFLFLRIGYRRKLHLRLIWEIFLGLRAPVPSSMFTFFDWSPDTFWSSKPSYKDLINLLELLRFPTYISLFTLMMRRQIYNQPYKSRIYASTLWMALMATKLFFLKIWVIFIRLVSGKFILSFWFKKT